MSTILEDRYGDRYRGLNIRDEVVLRTACGCEKIISSPMGTHVIRVQLHEYHAKTYNGNTGRYSPIRQFASHGGWTDPTGRPVFCEWLEQSEQEDWKHRYQELYKEVYGMDKGL